MSRTATCARIEARVLALALGLLLLTTAAAAGGEGRSTFGGRFESMFARRVAGGRGLSERDLLLELSWGYEWGKRWRIQALGRGRYEDRLEPEPYREAELRELTLVRRGTGSTLKIGRQQVVWGKADGLRLLDLVNPLDLRELVFDDYEDSRIPLWMLNAELFRGEQSFQLLVIPDLTFNRLAAPGGEFYAAPPLPESVGAVVREVDEPAGRVDNWEYGFQWGTRIGALALTANAFYGWDDTPVPFRHLSSTGIEVTPTIERRGIVGLSGDVPVGATVLRFEATYTPDDYREIAAAGGLGDFRRQQVWRSVLGLDWIRRNWLISPQWFEERVLSPDAGLAGEDRLSYLTMLVRKTLRQERLVLRLFYAYGFEHGDEWLSSKISYRFHGRLEVTLGADLLDGKPAGFFGRFATRDRITVATSIRF